MKTYIILLSLAFTMLSSGCTSGAKDAARIATMMNQSGHESVMRDFINKAKEDDVDGMIAITSKLTIKEMGGIENMRTHYIADTIPSLKAIQSILPEDDSSKCTRDNHGHYGWALRKTVISASGKKVHLQFTVFREDGKLVIAYFGLWE